MTRGFWFAILMASLFGADLDHGLYLSAICDLLLLLICAHSMQMLAGRGQSGD